MSSPLREDKHPSFGIFKSSKTGQLLFKDQSTGESGNCVKFVQLLYNLDTYNQALKQIWEEVIIKRHFRKSKKGQFIASSKFESKKTILIKRRNWTSYDDEYWKQYKIDRKTLNKFNVHPIESFWVNDIKSNLTNSKNCPMYAYKVFNAFKIYRPMSKIKADKWRSNCTKYDIQGWEQLPEKGDVVVITKSLKDVMVLSRFKILSVAPHSEVSVVPSEVIYELKKKFKKVIVLYDNDITGKQSSELLSDIFDLNNAMIPSHYLELYGIKDISDFIKEFGIMKTKELLKEIL
ncbi:MAG: hypothetical protein ACOCUI_02150 [bacterium]